MIETDEAVTLSRHGMTSGSEEIAAYAETVMSYAVFRLRDHYLTDPPAPVVQALTVLRNYRRTKV